MTQCQLLSPQWEVFAGPSVRRQSVHLKTCDFERLTLFSAVTTLPKSPEGLMMDALLALDLPRFHSPACLRQRLVLTRSLSAMLTGRQLEVSLHLSSYHSCWPVHPCPVLFGPFISDLPAS